MNWFLRLPIRRKLMVVVLASCACAMALATAFLTRFQRGELRQTLVRDTSVLADILAENSRAAIAFDDRSDAQLKLRTLQAEPRVMAACLYGKDGRRVATYLRAGDPGACSEESEAVGFRFDTDALSVVRPVVLNGKQIGGIFIQSDLKGIREHLWVFAGTAFLVLMGAVAVAMALASRLQRGISGPILALAKTAQEIAESEDFTVRASRLAEDEVGALADAFNAMVGKVEDRERALQGAISALQSENAERKNAENSVQAQLARLELLDRITRAIGERQDIQSIFQVVVRSLEDHLVVDFCCVCLFDEVERSLSVSSIGLRSPGLGAELLAADASSLPIDESLALCLDGSLRYEPDTGLVPAAFTQRLASAGLRSLVVAPLLVESRVFGLLMVARRSPDAFESGECQFLRQVSEHSGLASHQAQLNGALKQAYDDLRQSQQAVMQQERLRALGQMASGIAHDINNAISPVALYAELLLESESQLSAEGREGLETIQRSIDDVAETVARMKEFYRDQEPQAILTPVQLNRLVPQVVDLTRVRWSDMAKKSGVAIRARTELDPDSPAILGSESELREALINLVFNAVDAMPEGGTLVIRTRSSAELRFAVGGDSRLVHLEVSDTGVGMDEETRNRCLEPFFTTKGERGTGLGLAMVYGSAKRHGAEVEIESSPGAGTTVRLTFAAFNGAAAERPIEGEVLRRIPSLKILAVDDDPIVLKALRECLERDGHSVATANDGQEGIAAFRDAHLSPAPFAVVITDLGMPYVDGRRVAAFIKACSPSTPVFMLTGWGQRLRADDEVPPHVDHLLSKPPKLRELRELLHGHFSSEKD